MLFNIEKYKNNNYKIDIFTCFIETKLFQQIY